MKNNIKKIAMVTTIITLSVVFVFMMFMQKYIKYTAAIKHFENKDYVEAIAFFEELENYRESEEKVKESRYLYAEQLYKGKEYELAMDELNKIKNFKDASEKCEIIRKEFVQVCVEKGSYSKAKRLLEGSANPKEDTDLYFYVNGAVYDEKGNVEKALENYSMVSNEYRDVSERINKICEPIYNKAVEFETTSYINAIKEYEKLPKQYKDVKQRLSQLKKYEDILGEYECYEESFDGTLGTTKDISGNRKHVVDIYTAADGIRIKLPDVSSGYTLEGYIRVNKNNFSINIPKDVSSYEAVYNNGLLMIKESYMYENSGNVLTDFLLGGLAKWVEHENVLKWKKVKSVMDVQIDKEPTEKEGIEKQM